MALKRVDFPALGRPTIPTESPMVAQLQAFEFECAMQCPYRLCHIRLVDDAGEMDLSGVDHLDVYPGFRKCRECLGEDPGCVANARSYQGDFCNGLRREYIEGA